MDWFGDNSAVSSEAGELIEGVLITAQREYEQRKLRYYANLLAEIIFRPDISASTANMLIRLGGSLSYRQLGIISLIHERNILDFRIRDYRYVDESSEGGLKPEDEPLFIEIHELCNKGVIARSDGTFVMDIVDINPSGMILRATGLLLHDLMDRL